MKTLSAVYCCYNEEQFIKQSIELILPFVNEVIVVDNESTDGTIEQIKSIRSPKIKVYKYPRVTPIDMGKIRSFSISWVTSKWWIQIDADEMYPPETMQVIKDAIENADQNGHISFRLKYHQMGWREGYEQASFEHYPDRVYRTDVVSHIGGVLPNDMTIVKPEFTKCLNKTNGLVGSLEYDNMDDRSFANPVQPILDAWYYHLARTTGYNKEYHKKRTYEKNMHPDVSEEEIEKNVRINSWVSGNYLMKPSEYPSWLPTHNIRNPKVSIIIPNFQYAQYIEECIDSCLNQTVKPHEIIVVDDGSKDDSPEVIAEIAKRKPITFLQQQNMGVATARNAGIAHSTGDYFICVDADDKLHPQFIEKTLEKMTGDIQVVYTDLEFFGDQTGTHSFPDPSEAEMRKWQIVPSACALVDRHCFDVSGGFWPQAHFEDYHFWLSLMIRCRFNFAHVPLFLFLYRKHGKSRIDMLDERQAYGFKQLQDEFQITRKPDADKVNTW